MYVPSAPISSQRERHCLFKVSHDLAMLFSSGHKQQCRQGRGCMNQCQKLPCPQGPVWGWRLLFLLPPVMHNSSITRRAGFPFLCLGSQQQSNTSSSSSSFSSAAAWLPSHRGSASSCGCPEMAKCSRELCLHTYTHTQFGKTLQLPGLSRFLHFKLVASASTAVLQQLSEMYSKRQCSWFPTYFWYHLLL